MKIIAKSIRSVAGELNDGLQINMMMRRSFFVPFQNHTGLEGRCMLKAFKEVAHI